MKRASRAPSDRATNDLEPEQGASSDQVVQATIADPELEHGASSDQVVQATIADPELGRMLRLDQDPQATNASADQDQMLRWDQVVQATNAITSAMEPQVEEPEEGPGEAAVGDSTETNPPTGAADSMETPLPTPWTLPVDATSTGVDSGVSPLAMMEQMAWETDADELPIARFAVTTEQSRLSSSTGVGTDLHAST